MRSKIGVSTPAILFALLAVCPFRSPAADGPPQLLLYRLKPGETLRYKLVANIKGSVPLFENPEPTDLDAVLTLVYRATPKTLLANGVSDVALQVESVEAELSKIPLPVAVEDVQKVLDQTISLDRSGEVKRVSGGGQMPFSVSVPGVDPKRLYALLFPIVFPAKPVRPGEKWEYRSELLGGEGTQTAFSAELLPAEEKAKETFLPLRSVFSMTVDQKIDAEKKPVQAGGEVYRARKGKIDGGGTFRFDPGKGRFQAGEIQLTAEMTDELIGKPLTPDDPKQLVSKISATIKLELLPPNAEGGKGKPAAKKEKP